MKWCETTSLPGLVVWGTYDVTPKIVIRRNEGWRQAIFNDDLKECQWIVELRVEPDSDSERFEIRSTPISRERV